MRNTGRIVTALVVLLPAARAAQNDWRSYGQHAGGTRHSSLNQITPANVATLARAWSYDTGEPANAYQTTPLVVDGLMYLSTPTQRIVALNAATGREVWKYDPANKRPGRIAASPTGRAAAARGPGLLTGVDPRGGAEVNGTIIAFSLPR